MKKVTSRAEKSHDIKINSKLFITVRRFPNAHYVSKLINHKRTPANYLHSPAILSLNDEIVWTSVCTCGYVS